MSGVRIDAPGIKPLVPTPEQSQPEAIPTALQGGTPVDGGISHLSGPQAVSHPDLTILESAESAPSGTPRLNQDEPGEGSPLSTTDQIELKKGRFEQLEEKAFMAQMDMGDPLTFEESNEKEALQSELQSAKGEDPLSGIESKIDLRTNGDSVLPPPRWAKTTAVLSKSSRGADGVLFMRAGAGGEFVVKPSKTAVAEYFASTLAKSLGLELPATTLVNPDDAKEIRDNIGGSSYLADKHVDTVKNEHLLAMEAASGVASASDKTPFMEGLEKMKDRGQFFKDVGKLYALDIMLNNVDRFPGIPSGSENMRNLHIGQLEGGDVRLLAIDTTPAAIPDQEASLKNAEELFKDPSSKASALEKCMIASGIIDPESEQKSQDTANLKEGLHEAVTILKDFAAGGKLSRFADDVSLKAGISSKIPKSMARMIDIEKSLTETY